MHQKHLQIAAQFHQAGELEKAEALYLQILQQSPRDPDIMQLLSLVASQTGRHGLAAEYIEQAIAITGGTPASCFHLAQSFEALGRLDDAVSAYRRSLALKPDFIEALSRLAWLQGSRSEDSRELLGRGLAAHQAGQRVQALRYIGQAIETAGGAPASRYHLARALESLDQVEEALSSYRMALASDPGLAEALFRLALLLGKQAREGRELLECYTNLARHFLAQGKLAAAEVFCREVLDRDGSNAGATATLEAIFSKLGLYDDGHGSKPDPRAGDAAGPRYLLVKSWGSGFWSDVSSVLGALLLAEVTGRTPVVHWGSNSLFRDDSGRDAFGLYFSPVSRCTLDDLVQLGGADVFPPKWNQANLSREDLSRWVGAYSRLSPMYYVNRKETIVVCDFYVNVADVVPWIPVRHPMHGHSVPDVFRWLIQKYVVPRPHIVEQADAFCRAHLAGRPFVAIHLRGSDKIREFGELEAINESLIRQLDAIDPGWPIFVLTDDEHWLRALRERFGERVVATSCTRSGTTQGVHFAAEGNDRVRVGTEVMVDSLIALRAARFIGAGASNVSGFISLMKDWAAADCMMSSLPVILQRNLYIYSYFE